MEKAIIVRIKTWVVSSQVIVAMSHPNSPSRQGYALKIVEISIGTTKETIRRFKICKLCNNEYHITEVFQFDKTLI